MDNVLDEKQKLTNFVHTAGPNTKDYVTSDKK